MDGNDRKALEARLRKLPRWAIVAFAARCARRAQPVLEVSWPNAPRRHIQAIETTISVAEQSSKAGRLVAGRNPSIPRDVREVGAIIFGALAGAASLFAALFAAFVVFLVFELDAPNKNSGTTLIAIVGVSFLTAIATISAAMLWRIRYSCADSAYAKRAGGVADAAFTVANSARATAPATAAATAAGNAAATVASHKDCPVAAANAAIGAHDALVSSYNADDAIDAAMADLELLEDLAEREHWTNKTRVPQSVFGDIWPNGPPERKKKEDDS